MVDQTNVFDDKNTPQSGENQDPPKDPPKETPSPNPSPNDVFADRLASIRNEEGNPKYDSVEKALDALNHSQTYIPQLKTELQQREEEINRLKTELDKRESVEDVISRMTAGREQDPPRNEETPSQSAGLDEQAAMSLFERMLSEKTQKQEVEQNQKSVQDSLFSRYGEKTAEVVAEKAKELGITPSKLGELAGQSPKMVEALFGSDGSGSPRPSTSSLNIPPNRQPEEDELKVEKSLLSGASAKEQAAFMRRIKERVYKRYGVENQ